MRRSCLATILAAYMLFACQPSWGAVAQTQNAVEETEELPFVSTESTIGFDEYAQSWGEAVPAEKAIRLTGASFIQENGSGAVARERWEDEADVLLWESGAGDVTWRFNVPQDALYTLQLTWLPMESGLDIRLGIKLDGAYPFAGMENLTFSRYWRDAQTTANTDSQGNEFSPEQVETEHFLQQKARDASGLVIEPYRFYLTAGDHTLTLVEPEQPLVIAALELLPPEKVQAYATLSQQYDIQPLDVAEPILLQGEDAAEKSTNSIIPLADNTDAGMIPCDPYLTKLNYIGGTAWQSPGETIIWDFYVEHAGYYQVGFRYKQSELINGESWRCMRIDGKIPFEEASQLRFPYDPRWQFRTFADADGEPYYIWLDAGEHQLSLEVTLGELAEHSSRLANVVQSIGDEYIKIVKITGESPDLNRDYELFAQIPGFNDMLDKHVEELEALAESMEELTGKRGSQYIAAINNMIRVLRTMRENPYAAQYYVADYYSNYTTLSSWLYDMKSMPLSLDEIQIVPVGQEFVDREIGFFQSLIYNAKRLLSSFTRDYRLSTSVDGREEIRLWVNWGRDQAMVLNSLIQENFTPNTGIQVRLEIVNASLVNGILSGNFPDVALFLSRTEPVNLGMRGALHDLSQFPDYSQVLERFQPGADTPYWYDGELYALPDSQNFYVLFYRKDILDSLSLSVPQTWDEFFYAAAIIQRNNMQVYLPYTQITSSTMVNSGMGSLHLLPTLMCQNGLSFYNADYTATALNTPKAIEVFREWTELYTEYQFVREADFYNRFRAGSMPLGLAPYSQYMTLYQAAPEIEGRWSIACVPSYGEGTGAVAGSGTGCAIIEKSQHHEAAWEFLKWWTSPEIQLRYAQYLETILGIVGRPQTATVEAFQNMAWPSDEKEILLQQWEAVQEIPEVPGSYYLVRAVDQALWSVLNEEADASDAIIKWSRVADSEIQRKIEEYRK